MFETPSPPEPASPSWKKLLLLMSIAAVFVATVTFIGPLSTAGDRFRGSLLGAGPFALGALTAWLWRRRRKSPPST